MKIKIDIDYDKLTAKEAIKEIRVVSSDELASILRYEVSHKNRKTVMSVILKEIDKRSEIKAKYIAEIQEGFTILQVGQTGVGKSATINSFFREEVAKTNRFDAETKEVKPYPSKYHGVNYTIYDTPGLGEAKGGIELDRHYLSLMTEQCSSPDILWHILNLDENRFKQHDMMAIKLIQETFGDEIWDRTLTVFTHADKCPKEDFKITLSEKTQGINELIAEVTNGKSKGVPAVAITNREPYTTPDGKNSLGELFTTTLEQVNPDRIHTFFLAFAEDLDVPDSNLSERILRESDTIEEVRKKRIELDEEQLKRVERKVAGASFVVTSAVIGTAFGMGVDVPLISAAIGIPTAIGGIVTGIMEFRKWLQGN